MTTQCFSVNPYDVFADTLLLTNGHMVTWSLLTAPSSPQ